jgi:hypothetical protein
MCSGTACILLDANCNKIGRKLSYLAVCVQLLSAHGKKGGKKKKIQQFSGNSTVLWNACFSPN